MNDVFGIVDLFSGPGGLGEGFCRLRRGGEAVFEIDVSVEKDSVAHSTLQLRSFLRKFGGELPREYLDFLNGAAPEPDWAALYPDQWASAEAEALNLTLGDRDANNQVDERIGEIRKKRGDRVILIGGPPCQAYSLAGRGRKPSDLGYVAHEENRHLLYEEYISVLRKLRPAAFVMENVKGMLSSSIENRMVFDLVTADLENQGGSPEYRLFPLSAKVPEGQKVSPSDFVVLAEEQGVPQARHRVIIVGIRRDLLKEVRGFKVPKLQGDVHEATVRDVLSEMPKLRSGISARDGRKDDPEAWRRTVRLAAMQIEEMPVALEGGQRERFLAALHEISGQTTEYGKVRTGAGGGTKLSDDCPEGLRDWI